MFNLKPFTVFAILGSMFVSGAALAQSPANVARDKTLIIAADVEAPVFRNVGNANPYSINSNDIRTSIVNMFEPLFYYNMAAGELVPWLAKSFAYSADFTSVTINLRSDVEWSDGQLFSAEDVAFTLNLLKENGKSKKDLLRSVDIAETVRNVEIIDNSTVKVNFNSPNPRFVETMLMNHMDVGLYMLPAHIWRNVEDPASFKFYDQANGWPITTGPWKVTRFTDNQIFMDRREKWWAASSGFAKMPAMERVIAVPGGTIDRMVQMISQNQVDTAPSINTVNVLKQLMVTNPKITTYSGNSAPYGSLDWWPLSLYFNHKSGKWSDVKVRRAINHYIDREQLIDVAWGGASEAKRDPFPAFASLKPYIDAVAPMAEKYGIGTFDKARGDELMLEAGYVKNASGIWEKDGEALTAVIDAITVLNNVVPIVTQQLKKAGIDASFRSTPESRSIMRDGKFDMVLFGHRGSTIDPYKTLEVYHSKNALEIGEPTLNPARWSNRDYDVFVDQLRTLSPNDPKVMDLVKGAMDIWMKEAVEVPIAEFYHRVPLNQTYWKNWPSSEKPYMLPASWYTSGTFGYVLMNLEPAQ